MCCAIWHCHIISCWWVSTIIFIYRCEIRGKYFSAKLLLIPECLSFWVFSGKLPEPLYIKCRPMTLICALSMAGHLLGLQAGFPSWSIIRKMHQPWNPLSRVMHDSCQRAAFPPVDKNKSISKGVMHWGRAAPHAASPAWGAQLSWKSPWHPSCSLESCTTAAFCH